MEIVGLISLRNSANFIFMNHLRCREEKLRGPFFLPEGCLISVLQRFTVKAQSFYT